MEIKPYDGKYIDEYLKLLDESMTFEKPAPNYRNGKTRYLKRFIEYRDKNSFEAFWNNNELIEIVLKNTVKVYAYLYAVDWNDKGRAFYDKYGMEKNGHSYLLCINKNVNTAK